MNEICWFVLLLSFDCLSSRIQLLSPWNKWLMYTHPFYLEKIEWGLPHLLLFFFFSYLRTHEYTHPPVTSIPQCILFWHIFSGLYSHCLWPHCLPVMETLWEEWGAQLQPWPRSAKLQRHLVGCPHCLHLQLLPSCISGPWPEYSNIISEYSSGGGCFELYLKANQANLLRSKWKKSFSPHLHRHAGSVSFISTNSDSGWTD